MPEQNPLPGEAPADIATFIEQRLHHEPTCRRPGWRWDVTEPTDRPGVSIVTADCLGCDASIFHEEHVRPVSPGER